MAFRFHDVAHFDNNKLSLKITYELLIPLIVHTTNVRLKFSKLQNEILKIRMKKEKVEAKLRKKYFESSLLYQ